VLVVQSEETLEPPTEQLPALMNGYGLPDVGETVHFSQDMVHSEGVRSEATQSVLASMIQDVASRCSPCA
jgi:hypothetical protein